MKTRRNKRSKLHYTSKKNGGGITPKYKADNVVEYIDGTEVTIIEQLSYKNGEWQYKIQFPDKSYRIIPESSIKRFIRKGDFMTVRVREHERELAAFAKEHPNWKRKSKPKAWNIESSDATSFEEHQKKARAAAVRAYTKEQLRKKESREQTNRIKKKTVLTKDLRNERQTVPSVEAKTREQPDLSKIDNMSSKNKDTRGFKWVKTLDGWAKIDESKVHEGIEELMRKSKIEEGIDESKAPEEDYEVWRRNNLSNIGVSLTEKHNLERNSNIKFTKGEEVFYHKSVDEKVLAKIVKIHYDDDEPYYTIRLQDGSEKQTIYSRLKKIESQDKSQDKSNISFKKGEKVFYYLDSSKSKKVLAVILEIRYDYDGAYYIIRLQDGSEKETYYSRLKKIESPQEDIDNFLTIDQFNDAHTAKYDVPNEALLDRRHRLTEVVEDLDVLESLGYGNPRTSEERIIWLNNYDNMVVQAAETDDEARLKYWWLWKRELEPYERDYWVSLFKRMWKAQMNGLVKNQLGL